MMKNWLPKMSWKVLVGVLVGVLSQFPSISKITKVIHLRKCWMSLKKHGSCKEMSLKEMVSLSKMLESKWQNMVIWEMYVSKLELVSKELNHFGGIASFFQNWLLGTLTGGTKTKVYLPPVSVPGAQSWKNNVIPQSTLNSLDTHSNQNSFSNQKRAKFKSIFFLPCQSTDINPNFKLRISYWSTFWGKDSTKEGKTI
jgi:hypothetical protein